MREVDPELVTSTLGRTRAKKREPKKQVVQIRPSPEVIEFSRPGSWLADAVDRELQAFVEAAR